MRIKISAADEGDIANSCDFYREIDIQLAIYFHDSISADIHATVDGWHYTFASRFPFVIWYALKDEFIVVYAVLDGRRDPGENKKALRSRR